jgi:hypothetical protein
VLKNPVRTPAASRNTDEPGNPVDDGGLVEIPEVFPGIFPGIFPGNLRGGMCSREYSREYLRGVFPGTVKK